MPVVPHDKAAILVAGHEYLNKVALAGVNPATLAIITKIIASLPAIVAFIEGFLPTPTPPSS